MAFLRFRTASPSVPTANETITSGLTSEQIDGNFKSLNDSKAEANGVGASGTWSIDISGNAATTTSATSAATWTTARTLTIGSSGKSVNGSADVAWSLADIGAAATNQTMFIGTTSVAINRSSGLLGLTGITSLSSGPGLSTLSIFSSNTTDGNSGALVLNSGTTTTSGNSGQASLKSGNSAQSSGDIFVESGSSSSGSSGSLYLRTGQSNSSFSGTIYIESGTTTGSAAGGIFIRTGQNIANSTGAGSIQIRAGNSLSTALSDNGHVYIYAGSPTAATGNKYGGKVYIDGGRPASGGTIIDEGEVRIGTQDIIGGVGTRNIRVGHANATTTITGIVQLPTVGTSGFVKLGASGALSADTNSYALTNQSFFIGTTSVAINRASASLSLAGVSIDGNAGTATTWATARTLTIGSSGKSVNGSANVSWSLAEIGAAATNQSFFIGTTSVAINRASASLSLTGVSIDGNAGTATTAAAWTTARTLTIGSSGKSVDGSANVSWTLAEIGAAATNQTMFIGTTSVAINRTTGSLSLTGVSVDGNAGTATTLQTSRTIWGQSFNGSANVSGDLSGVGAITVGKSLFETRIAVAASNIDLSLGNMFTRTISTTTTLTVSNVPAAGTVASFILDLTNGGSASINWWSGVKWAEGTAPTLTSSGRDVLGFFTHDGGTTWTGLLLGKDVK